MVDGRIYASNAEAAFADRTDTGERAWRFAPDAYLLDATAVFDDTTIVHASHSDDDRNRLVGGVAADDGAERWRFCCRGASDNSDAWR